MTDESLMGKTVKLPGIDSLVTVLKTDTCGHEGCTEDVLVIRPPGADRPFPVHAAGYRTLSTWQPEADEQTNDETPTTGGKHAAKR